tara:strand:- start:4894 stop:5700 length:807 start_codon:yes stop_codon:yes gene_type:complete
VKKIAVAFLFLSLSTSSVQASFLENLKENMRPTLNRLLGEDLTTNLLGQAPSVIELPEIPKIKNNAKSVIGLNTKPKVEVSYEKEQIDRFNYIFIQEMVKSVRQMEPSGEEVSRWMNVLSQNGSREGVYSALVLDNTYMGLQNLDRLVAPKVLDFTVDFLSKFVNKSISKDNLAKVNFFVVKREIAERTLQVVDELFKKSGDDIYDWYAVFSSDLANKYPKAMTNEVRKVTSPLAHKAWAKSVPDQFVKSEILIKLHEVFNHLQSSPQ